MSDIVFSGNQIVSDVTNSSDIQDSLLYDESDEQGYSLSVYNSEIVGVNVSDYPDFLTILNDVSRPEPLFAASDGPLTSNLQFTGDLQTLTTILVNPYTGETVNFSDTVLLNNTIYTGSEGVEDTLLFTNQNDALFIRNAQDAQTVFNVESYLVGDGNNIVMLADAEFILGNVLILGGVENDILWSNAGDDEIHAGGGADHVNGGTGDDVLYGDQGSDVLYGAAGNDTIDGGIENDVMYGGVGNDTYIFSEGYDTIFDQETGGDVNRISITLGAGFTEDDIEFKFLGRSLGIQFGNDLTRIEDQFIDGLGVSFLDYTLAGGGTGTIDLRALGIGPTDGNDVFVGTAVNDEFYGGLGSDSLSSGAGDDILHYSQDAVWPSAFVAWNVGSPDAPMNGERVTISPRYRNHDGFDGGDGFDFLIMGDESEALFLDDRYSANPFGANTARLVDIEQIEAGAGDDIVDLTSTQFTYGDVTIIGGAGDDVLWSNAGSDILDGGDGNDHLDGGSGDDLIIGGAGDDVMYGRSGNDLFRVGEGADTIYGGEGADRILYDVLDSAIDLIKDFDSTPGGDLLILANIVDYDNATDVLFDYVQTVDIDGDTWVYVNSDGDLGGDYVHIAIIEGGLSDSLSQLVSQDIIILDF